MIRVYSSSGKHFCTVGVLCLALYQVYVFIGTVVSVSQHTSAVGVFHAGDSPVIRATRRRVAISPPTTPITVFVTRHSQCTYRAMGSPDPSLQTSGVYHGVCIGLGPPPHALLSPLEDCTKPRCSEII